MNACFIGVEVPFIWTLLLLRPHSITWKGRLRGFGSAVCLKKNAEFHHSMTLILSKWPIYPKWINKYRLPSGREVMLPNLTASPRHDGHGGRKQKRAPFFFGPASEPLLAPTPDTSVAGHPRLAAHGGCQRHGGAPARTAASKEDL